MRPAAGPTRPSTRSRISAAALLVNVIAMTSPARARPVASRYAMRLVSTRVLPEPAPATISSGPPWCSTASRCCGLRPRSRASASRAATGRGRLARGVCGGAREGQGEVLEERRHGPSRIGAGTDRPVLPVERAGQVSASAVSQRTRGHQGRGELHQDGQPGGLQRRHGGPPGGSRLARAQPLREVDPEHEADEQADHGDREEPDDARDPAPDQRGRRHARALEVPAGQQVLADAREHGDDDRDRDDRPPRGTPGDDAPDDDRAGDEEPAGQHLDDDAEQPDEHDEPDQEVTDRVHGVDSNRAQRQRTAIATFSAVRPAMAPR